MSADTWTKENKNIPGNYNVTFNNDNASTDDMELDVKLEYGSTGTARSCNQQQSKQWATYYFRVIYRYPNIRSTLVHIYFLMHANLVSYRVQLEVGPVATPFEHRSLRR